MHPIRNSRWIKPAVLTLLALGLAAQTPPPYKDFPQNMKQYFVGFLVEGAKSPQPQTANEPDPLTAKHLAYIRSQIEAGKYLLAGPFLDNDRIRGMVIVKAANVEEARQLLNGDPLVKAGRSNVEVHPAMLPDVSAVRVDYGTAK
jgi:uncharacterized protein YciI